MIFEKQVVHRHGDNYYLHTCSGVMCLGQQKTLTTRALEAFKKEQELEWALIDKALEEKKRLESYRNKNGRRRPIGFPEPMTDSECEWAYTLHEKKIPWSEIVKELGRGSDSFVSKHVNEWARRNGRKPTKITKTRSPLTEGLRRKVVNAFRAGKSMKAIMLEYNISEHMYYRILQEEGLKDTNVGRKASGIPIF